MELVNSVLDSSCVVGEFGPSLLPSKESGVVKVSNIVVTWPTGKPAVVVVTGVTSGEIELTLDGNPVAVFKVLEMSKGIEGTSMGSLEVSASVVEI